MLDFLRSANISDFAVNYIEDNFSNVELAALVDNSNECLKIISYFRRIGIIQIDNLLMYETYIFLKLYNRVMDSLSKYDISTFVNDVNDDYVCIENYI